VPDKKTVQAMKAIRIESPGDRYRLVTVEETPPKPAAGQVLIRVAATGLNNADLLQARGLYPPPPGASPILGMEVSGVIQELGDGVSGWKVGDRVCALLPGGGYAELAVADAGSLLPLPAPAAMINSRPHKEGRCPRSWSPTMTPPSARC